MTFFACGTVMIVILTLFDSGAAGAAACGDVPMSFQRQFLWEDMVYEMRIPSKGFVYVLDPPLPVNVLEGNIMGDQKTPIIGYVPKPNVRYPGPPPPAPDSPEAKAGGGAAPAGGGEE